MNPDWIAGFGGGLLIGLAASVYLLFNGRIMGASGIIGGLIDRTARGFAAAERVVFLAALFLVPLLLVGFGTRMGNGCTSGHGVCGISRLSRRGIIATISFLLAGGVGVIAARTLGMSL